MTGDDKCRFCSQCQLHVHNLSAMAPAESVALLSGRGTRHCLAFYATDHSIRVHTSTWVLLQKLLRPWRALTAFLALLVPAGLSSCSTTPPTPPASEVETRAAELTLGKPKAVAEQRPSGKEPVITGGVPVYEPPFWRRILFFWER